MTSGFRRSRRPLRLLHSSDVHLGAYDSAGITPGRRESWHAGFSSVIDAGLRHEVDAVVIAGDFFDHARVLEDTLRFAAAEVARAEVPVVVVPGNHDHVGPGSVYDRIDLTSLAPNLRLERAPEGETVALEELDLEIWGRAHTEQDPRFEPFVGAPPRGEAAWQIGAGHGHFIHPLAAMHHSFHITEAQLAQFHRDYVALGHWERQVRVAAGPASVAAYSGAPESLGGSGGLVGGRVLIVDLCADGSVRLSGESLDGGPSIEHNAIPYLHGA